MSDLRHEIVGPVCKIQIGRVCGILTSGFRLQAVAIGEELDIISEDE